jgi:hypothetical protein
LFSVSFILPSFPRRAGQKRIEGGFEQIPLKKEKGAKLKTPFLDWVETKAMGRGTMDPIISL